ncbi:DUF4440 domain-containing protein [Brachybacterium ginsengisoli]|uniref:DUF4440 domain-containing protein n=1 Tax=Brachybacterium ginsengisoli TaxID=1331682 RepID=A0A291GXQ3_9MICO|nr:DUF4440 domain-containing protein [Brachybacterium ginsengisoli]
MTTTSTSSSDSVHDHQPAPVAEISDALRRVVGDVERGFTENDAGLLVRHVAPDAVIVNALGAVLRGRAAVEAATRAGLSRGPLSTATAHYRLSDIALVAPDVAVAHKSAWSTVEDADRGAPPEMNAHYVFVRREGRWWILRRQNTLVADARS